MGALTTQHDGVILAGILRNLTHARAQLRDHETCDRDARGAARVAVAPDSAFFAVAFSIVMSAIFSPLVCSVTAPPYRDVREIRAGPNER